MDSGQYVVHAKSQSKEQGILTVTSSSEEPIDATYQPTEGIILTIEKSADYDEHTCNRVAEIFGEKAANYLRKAKSKWDQIYSDVATAGKNLMIDFGTNLVIFAIEPLAKSNMESAVVFEMFIEAHNDPGASISLTSMKWKYHDCRKIDRLLPSITEKVSLKSVFNSQSNR